MTGIDHDLGTVVGERLREVATSISPAQAGREMGDRLLAEIPEFADLSDEDFREGIIMSCASNIATIREALMNGSTLEELTPPQDATAWAHDLVHRGMPVAALLRAYRLGHGLFERTFEDLVATVESDPEVRWRVLAGASRVMFRYIDIVCTQLVDEYESEREQWLRGAAAAQAELVQAIVAGEALDAGEASATLRYDVDAAHLGLIVWRDARSRGQAQARPLASIARGLAGELGGMRTLVVPIGEHAAWAWTSGSREQLLAAAAARSTMLGDQANAAVGATHAGLAGMFRTHQEARLARRVGEIFGSRPGAVVRYSSVALASLITADPTQAADFAVGELGGELAADSDAMLRLRATIRVYLDERLSPSRTARRLGIHQNTVVYRVQRAEELLGRPLEERRLELEIALRLFDGLDGLRSVAQRGT